MTGKVDISVNKTDKNPSSQGTYLLGDPIITFKLPMGGGGDTFQELKWQNVA